MSYGFLFFLPTLIEIKSHPFLILEHHLTGKNVLWHTLIIIHIIYIQERMVLIFTQQVGQ